MSDRFKFRAWNNELEGYGYFNLGGRPKWDSVTKGNKTYHYSGLDCADTVEQCTGLKDKNGTLIFEGDILTYKGTKKIAIEWCTKTASFMIFGGADWPVFIRHNKSRDFEVIGSIHDA